MIDMRYLLVTVTAIFLALAVGTEFGLALATPARQDSFYTKLSSEFDGLRQQNEQVKTENDTFRRRLSARQQALGELLPFVVKDRLAGATVGVLICGSWDERPFWGDLENVLHAAGAQFGPIVRIPDQLKELSPEDRARFGNLWGTSPLPARPVRFEAADWLVRALARHGTNQRVEELARDTGMEIRAAYPSPIKKLIILTSAPDEDRATSIGNGDVPDVTIVNAVRDEGLRALVAEPEDTPTSAVEPLQRTGIPTVDDIDSPSGQISAVLILAGEAEGHFGSKPSATRAIPALPQQ